MKQTVRQSYQAVASLMMRDLQGTNAGWENEQAQIRMAYPGLEEPLTVDAVILKREKGMIIYTPKIAVNTFCYGVNMVPEKEVEIIKGH